MTKTTVKLPRFFKGTARKARAYKWIALLHVCRYAAHGNQMCRGYDLAIWIKRRLVRDYGFDHNHFSEQMDSPKFQPAYNRDLVPIIYGWNKYLERLEAE